MRNYPIHGSWGSKVAGDWRLIFRNPLTMAIEHDTGWEPNLITDYGILACATDGGVFTYGSIGNSAVAPSYGNSSLGNFLAYSTSSLGSTNVSSGFPEYRFISTRGYRFDAGVGTGQIREIGMGKSQTGTQLYSHCAISPEFDKLANLVLDTYYRLTMWPNLIDVDGSGIIGGDDPETYITKCRPQRLDQGADLFSAWSPISSLQRVYDGELNPDIEANTPLGSTGDHKILGLSGLGAGTVANGAYTDGQLIAGLDSGNVSGGIRCTAMWNGNGHSTQIRFGADGNGTLGLDAKIPKDYRKELTLNLRYTWVRA